MKMVFKVLSGLLLGLLLTSCGDVLQKNSTPDRSLLPTACINGVIPAIDLTSSDALALLKEKKIISNLTIFNIIVINFKQL